MAKNLMIQGTMSNAGKSIITAGILRVLKQDGYSVAPFKSQNMALNSYITKEGLEMGRAQVMQAEAAGIEPSVHMNPILLKPTNDVGSQVIVNGEVLGNMSARDYFTYKKKLIPDICKAFQELEKQADIIVIEGAGSPAEINLKKDDMVNMGMAKLVDAPVLLVGDIDRGGVFAQLLGTLMLLEEEEKERLQKAVQEADAESKAKTDFMNRISHDIRTPMNAIVGLTAIAGANIENQDRVVECLGKITKSSRHLLGLINEVLDMARIESGRMSLAEEDFSLPELVDNLLTLTKPVIDEHHHQLEVHIEHIEHEAVCGDSLRIQQVFVNLMSNAVKYTPDGGNITLTIKEKPNGFSELGCYEFSIEDNGIGMTPEFQKIMFEPFSRADDHRTTKVQGTGLGMAIARNIVNLMNGDIQVESAPNKGTKITVTVYLKLQENEKEQEKELLDLPVLVVDDDKTCCESTVATLQEIGIAGEWVLTGKEAVERCYARHETNSDYFAVILDWKMPEMDGIATARKIRERVGEDVTIIILTSFDFSEIEEEARAAGVNAFMAKPLFRSRLTATLRQFTSGKKEKNARNYLEDFAKENYAGKRILLVEDNELNREIATEIIGMTGVTIDIAENGKIAVEKVMEAPEKWYDLIFMDIQMPIMNGYEATAAIRALAGSRGKVPIIAMTANAFAEDVQLAKNTGMNEHIAKPLDLNKLNDVLKRWL